MNDIVEIDHESASAENESAPKGQEHLGGIAAIARCILAKRRARTEVIARSGSGYGAKRASAKAYLLALPPLSDLDNVRDFIACVTYAIATEVISAKDSLQLLMAAKAALVALRRSQEPSSLRAA